MSDDQKWELIESIAAKFMKKVARERTARLNGEIVAADFYLRQITVTEVMLDLMSTNFGFDAREVLRDLRRGQYKVQDIASTELTDWLDASRRLWWGEEGEPERPPHPDVRFLQRHRSDDGDFHTCVSQHATGALTTPARGYSKEEWAQMNDKEQLAARKRQFEEDAAEQRAYEQRAFEQWRERASGEAKARATVWVSGRDA